MSRCERCMFRRYAEKRPKTLFARLWRWHTTWCPGWKKYQATLKRPDAPAAPVAASPAAAAPKTKEKE